MQHSSLIIMSGSHSSAGHGSNYHGSNYPFISNPLEGRAAMRDAALKITL
jgi:predicted alternative tryptophan synthase beta-subunit